jgi:Domain of unknown function (DUF4405)
MKSKLNFIIDAIMFVLMGALAGIGLLIKYILLPGSERWIKYGRNVDLSFWGIDRHQWANIHLIVAYILVGSLALHLILHWKMIVGLYRKIIANKALRWVCGLTFAFITLILIFAPFFINVEMDELKTGHERHQTIENAKTPLSDTIKSVEVVEKKIEAHEEHQGEDHLLHHHVDSSIEIKGFMTLTEISEKYNVPCEFIKEKLNLPDNESNSSKLGQLKKAYGFKMSDIELIICNYQNSGNHEKDN